MNNEKIQVFASMGDLERVNERFAKVKIRIAYEGKNRNKSYISKEAFEKAIPTLKFVPVVGYYLDSEKMFDGHTEKLEITDDEITLKTLTKPYGVVTDEKPFWEDVKTINGEIKSYLTCYAMLWIARYPELEGIKEGDFSQSMEIMCNEGYWSESDGLYHIEDLTFDALCILQKEEPCFEDSIITLNFSKDKFEDEYKSMIAELKEYTFSLLEEGGVDVEDNKELEIVETTKVAETEEVKAEVVEESVVEEVTENDEVEEAKEEEVKEDSEVEVETEPETVIEETEDFEHKYNEAIKELNELKAKYTDLKSDYDTLQEENKELTNFKLGIEKEQKDIELNSIFEKYSALNKVEGYDSLFEKRYELDEEELIKSLKVLAFDNNININVKNKKDFSKNSIKIPVVSVEKDINRSTAWDILEKHIK